MRWLKPVAREVYGLFVEDGSFAVTLLAWIVIAGVALRLLHAGHWSGPVFLLGLAVALAENTLRASRRVRKGVSRRRG